MFSPLPDVPAPLFFYGHSGWVVAFGRGRGGGVVCGHGVQRTKCMGRRNPVGRCAWAELEWCNYSRTLPILLSFPYLRALPYPFHFPNADKLKTNDALGLDAWRWLVVLAFLCVGAWLTTLLGFQERRDSAPNGAPHWLLLDLPCHGTLVLPSSAGRPAQTVSCVR